MSYEIGQRLKECIFKAKKTQRDIAAFLELSPSTLSTYITTGVGLADRHIVSACEHFKFSLDYVFSGEGSPLVEVKMMDKAGQVVPAPGGVSPNVKYLDFRSLAANFVATEIPNESRTVIEAWVPWLPHRQKNVYCVRFEGDGMSPTLKDGDWLFLDLLADKTEFVGGVYVLVLASGLSICKRVDRIVDEADANFGRLALRSDNTKVQTQFVDREAVVAVFKILSVVSNSPIL